MGDEPGNLPGRTADRRLDAATRERLRSVLREEIERAGNDALARGVTPEQLTAHLDERIARLRAQLDELNAKGEPEQS